MGAEPKNILLTGTAGFVGSVLRPLLQAALPQAQIHDTGALDIARRADVRACIAALRPDVCLHLAGIAAIGAARADPMRAWAVNFHGSLHIAEAMLESAPTGRLIFISSAEAYGASFAAGAALDETAALAPMNLYAATKAAADLALGAMAAAEGLRLIRLRPFNHTGPGQSEDFVVPAFARQIARIEAGLAAPEILVGALTPERDFLDVRDVGAAYVRCIEAQAALPENLVLNIASGHALRIGAILDLLLAQAHCKITVRQDPARLRPVEIARAVGNAGQAMARLGWQPRHGLAETLASVLAAARAATARAG